MSVYLLAPRHRPDEHAMLMYIQTVRNLSQRGADWRSYDEAFRSLRMANNWAWDEVCWSLWMDASEGRRVASNNASPFQGSVQVCQNSSAIPSTGGKNAMKLPVATATAAKCVVEPMQQYGVTRHHTPSSVRVPCQFVQRPPVRDLLGSKNNMPTPVSHIALSRILCGYDENLVQFIINGFKNGFRIGCYGLKSETSMVKNSKIGR